MSFPRTFSWTWIPISPSAYVLTERFPSATPSSSAISCASGKFAVPEKIFMSAKVGFGSALSTISIALSLCGFASAAAGRNIDPTARKASMATGNTPPSSSSSSRDADTDADIAADTPTAARAADPTAIRRFAMVPTERTPTRAAETACAEISADRERESVSMGASHDSSRARQYIWRNSPPLIVS